MGRLVIGLLIGLVLGGALTFYLFVGVPQAVIAPGTPVQAPDPNGVAPGAAQIVLRRQFFNEVLGTIFKEMNTGSYASPFGCLRFTGWAQSHFAMRFDAPNQAVFGQLNVETVNLDGVNPVVGALLTPIVQSTLNTRVNPIRILDGRQIAVDLPVAAANGNLQAAVTDVRAEVKDDALNLYVIYDFAGAPLSAASPNP